MKKLLSLTLVLVLCFTLFACGEGNKAQYNFKYTYELEGDSAVINGFEGTIGGDIVIPEELDGYSVTSISNGAFDGCTEITSVNIPGSVIVIHMNAFNGCDELKKVTFGEGVMMIDTWAFSDCKKLKSVTIPDSVMLISNMAFERSDKVTIYADEDSYAYEYAQKNYIPVKASD